MRTSILTKLALFLIPIISQAQNTSTYTNQYGQPVKIVPVHSSGSSYSDPLLTIKPDAYGMGVGSDQYGRPVKIVPAD